MNKIQKEILNKLLDKYEGSKSYLEKNKVQQNFYVDIAKTYPKYNDDAEYDFFIETNSSLMELEKEEFIRIKKSQNGIIEKAILNIDSLHRCYKALDRIPKKEEHMWLNEVYSEYMKCRIIDDELFNYINAQREKIKNNQRVEYFDGKHNEYTDILTMASEILKNKNELFIRDFSMRVFKNSKRAEQLKSKVESLLFKYGDYEEKDHVLEECGVVSTPTYVMMKGNGIISLSGQKVNLSALSGDIALSTASISNLDSVLIMGKRVLTVENLTSFHDYCAGDDFVIYLGGFHNKIKRDFICYIHKNNPDLEYYHFGDIDAGGFNILEHLRKKTDIPFLPYCMDVNTLKKYKKFWSNLTEGDCKRLKQLLENYKKLSVSDDLYKKICLTTVEYMLDNNCKLEQEAVTIS